MANTFSFFQIGTVHCLNQYKFEAPRQGVFGQGSCARIELEEGYNFEAALEDLEGFERIWVLFVFDRNHDWKPKVTPPLTNGKNRYGVFATRSPHRPNPVGMSCVTLERIEGRTLYIRDHDLLDGTPVLDIKPYIPAADAFPGSKAGWRDEVDAAEIPVTFTETMQRKAEYLLRLSGLDLLNFCRVQLSHDPVNPSRKRIEHLSEEQYSIGCRTWRILYAWDGMQVEVRDVHSHYKPDELAPDAEDPYQDKDVHRCFIMEFGR